MPRALNRLRHDLHYRRDAYDRGLLAAGFQPVERLTDPQPDDVLLIWNRYAGYHEQAQHFERCGARVLVTENGSMGKNWRGREWFSLALGHQAGAGTFVDGSAERWDSWGVDLEPWRPNGVETVILGQRGIGEPGIASPSGWDQMARARTGGRIRAHPGRNQGASTPLTLDIANARECITWHSGAALLALLHGVPVWYDAPHWIGAPGGRPFAEWPGEPLRDDAARLRTFRRLAWANWSLDEIASGEPIWRLLG